MLFNLLILCVSFLCGTAYTPESKCKKFRYTQDTGTYYTFAYAYGNNNVLLITEVEKVTIPVNKHLSPEVQLYNFVRDNNLKFKKFIRSHFPQHKGSLRQPVDMIFLEADRQKAIKEWDVKIRANKNEVIYVKNFDFIEYKPSEKKSNPGIE